MKLLLLVITFLLLTCRVESLHFILDGGEMKCFLEDLPAETTVIGNYKALQWSDQNNKYEDNAAANVQISVVTPSRHDLVDQKGQSKGKFTFTTSDSGEYTICLMVVGSGSWFTHSKTKMHFDLLFGDVLHDVTSGTKTVVNDLSMRVRDLASRINAIFREQRYQREREAMFRNASEAINSKVIHWTICQVVILVITGFWQTRHLKQFFVEKKLL